MVYAHIVLNAQNSSSPGLEEAFEISFCLLQCLIPKHFMLSANFFTIAPVNKAAKSRSLMNIKNSVGPSTEPCGTPESCAYSDDLPSSTVCVSYCITTKLSNI